MDDMANGTLQSSGSDSDRRDAERGRLLPGDAWADPERSKNSTISHCEIARREMSEFSNGPRFPRS